MTTTKLPLIKERLEELGIRPSKGLGQNFLISSSAYEKIIRAGEIERGEQIVEIGPGLGTLTEYLIEAGAKVIAVEKDRKLIPFLNSQCQGPALTLVEGDALEVDPVKLGLRESNYKIIANIPYYITSRLLRTIFESWPKPKLVVLLVQKEVAQRIIAKPPHMNLLAISIQYFATPKIISTVPRGSFYPVPEVDSAIIKIVPRGPSFAKATAGKQVTEEDHKKFFRVVKTGFSSKRKKLVNNLAAGLKMEKKDLENLLVELNIDPNVRPENLTIPQWQALVKKLS